MTTLRTTVLPTLLALAVMPAAPEPAVAEDSGWYVEGQFGEASFDTRLGRRQVKFFTDEASTAGLEAGYRFNRYLSIQGGFHDLGEFSGDGALCPDDSDVCINSLIERLANLLPGLEPEILRLCAEGFDCSFVAIPLGADVTSWSFSLVPRLPLGDRVALRGRLGVMAWEADISADFGIGFIERFSGEAPIVGLGLELTLSEPLAAVVEYRTTDFDLDLISAGIRWQFD